MSLASRRAPRGLGGLAFQLQGANRMRVYVSDVHSAVVGAAALWSHGNPDASTAQTLVEVITELEDGTKIYARIRSAAATTHQGPVRSRPLDSPPHVLE